MAYYPQNLNPFLADFLADDDNFSSADSYETAELPPPDFYPPPPPHPVMSNFKLAAFWPDAPVAWFGAAEAQFRLRRVTSEDERFCHVVAALDKQSLKKIVHLVVSPDPLLAYSKLKEALLACHQLTDFQRVELLHAMEPLGARKPTELLADMWELCPPQQHKNIFFSVLFLQRLPRDIRVLLTHEDHSDLRDLAAKADRLMAFGGRQETVAAALEVPQEEVIAAVQHKGKHHPQKKHQQKKQPPPLPPRPQTTARGQQQRADNPSAVARQATGLCFYHWSFGERANSCQAPCSWQGN